MKDPVPVKQKAELNKWNKLTRGVIIGTFFILLILAEFVPTQMLFALPLIWSAVAIVVVCVRRRMKTKKRGPGAGSGSAEVLTPLPGQLQESKGNMRKEIQIINEEGAKTKWSMVSASSFSYRQSCCSD